MLVIKCNNKNVRDSIIITIGFSISSIWFCSPFFSIDVQKKYTEHCSPFFVDAVGRLGGMRKITKV